MALSTLPYKFRLVSVTPDGAGSGWLVNLNVENSTNQVRGSVTVNVGMGQTYVDIGNIFREQVIMQMEADAGGRLQLLQALIGLHIAV